MKYTAKFEILRKDLGMVELTDENGQWAGFFRVEPGKSKKRLYDLGYDVASREAKVKGGSLDRFTQV